MALKNLSYIPFGGDYNPDQWPEEIWKEDMRLFKLAGINIVTLPVFSWARLQPAEDSYDFDWLDKIFDLLLKNNINVCLATSTAAQPAWMSLKYPEVLPVDFEGRKRKHGGRVNFCPNSKKYRELSVRLAGKIAERYKNSTNLVAWHIGNEYGNYCYCDNCAKEFRLWLKERYGTIEELNKRWNMNFWGHTVYDWDEIVVPSGLNEMWKEPVRDGSCFQGISLDYNRFMSDSILACYLGEYKAIKEITPDIPITTNLMGTFKPLDYFKWAEHMDIVSWDNYPALTDAPAITALRHDLMRSLKGGQPFMLMEQTPSQQNWQYYNSVKRPGVMRLQSYQAVAHGADTVMFFQLRQSVGACEKYHAAVISHAGHENTRVFKECTHLGKELMSIGDRLFDSKLKSKIGIIFDWDNWWALEFSSGPSVELKYLKQIEKYYSAFHAMNIPVDFVRPEGDFSAYDIIIAPVLYMLKPGAAENFESFVEKGGSFVTTFFSGYVDGNDRVQLGGYPAQLRKLLGLWVEEIDALFPNMSNSIVMKAHQEHFRKEYNCGMLCDIINTEGAEVLAVYGSDFYEGRPVLTVNKFGTGRAYYIASDGEEAFIKDFAKYLCEEKGINSSFDAEANVEITQRFKDGREFTFILNHNDHEATVSLGSGNYLDILRSSEAEGNLVLKAKDIAVLEKI
ncbi:MAG: beta-galactosidase [Bacillota bacterium]|nr:beta-galactosidase [Bacillota bacterium]